MESLLRIQETNKLTEVDSTNYFTEQLEEAQEEPPKQENTDYSFLEGICGDCLDTGFKHTIKDGILGVAYTNFSEDSNGNSIKRLMVCNHNKNTSI